MVVSAQDVAASIIERLNPIDNMKLQKLLYLAAGHYLAISGDPMFPEAIEAWEHGPVVNSVYALYAGELEIARPKRGSSALLDEVGVGCVAATVQFFGRKSGVELRNLTHKQGPWGAYYKPGDRHCLIPNSAMLRWFRFQLSGIGASGHVDERYTDGMAADAKTKRDWTTPASPAKLAVIERLSVAAAAKPAPPWVPRHKIR